MINIYCRRNLETLRIEITLNNESWCIDTAPAINKWRYSIILITTMSKFIKRLTQTSCTYLKCSPLKKIIITLTTVLTFEIRYNMKVENLNVANIFISFLCRPRFNTYRLFKTTYNNLYSSVFTILLTLHTRNTSGSTFFKIRFLNNHISHYYRLAREITENGRPLQRTRFEDQIQRRS